MNAGTSIKTRTCEPVLASPCVDEASVNEFVAKVESQLAQGAKLIEIDCSLLVRVTSSHINGLWLAHERCQAEEASVELTHMSDGLRRVLEALNLTRFFLREAPGPARFALEVLPAAEHIDTAMSKVVSFLTKSGLPEITAFELQTIFYEIMTNIRLHGQLQPDDLISVHVKVEEHKVTLSFSDAGVSFDPTSHDLDVEAREAGRQRQCRGFGLAMVKGLSESLKYARTADARNQLIITKSW